MERTELLLFVILWFAMAGYAQTTPGDPGVIVSMIELGVIGLLWILPLYLIARITFDQVDRETQ